ncbi:MAG TPA: PilZ domain-containing protein [Fimbriimonadaceae bacterium]|nr:PilZ domain-containing protein [Fimbriimonadaceae bacterium]
MTRYQTALAQFNAGRVRVQRLRDYKLFHGWVATIFETEIVLSLPELGDLAVGENVAIEIAGPKVLAMGTARISFVEGGAAGSDGRISLHLANPLKFIDSTNTGRVRVPPHVVSLKIGEKKVAGRLLDGSTGGIGLSSEAAVDRGATGTLSIDSGHGTIDLTVEVRYCRPNAESGFRVGLQIIEGQRLEVARWCQIVESGFSGTDRRAA